MFFSNMTNIPKFYITFLISYEEERKILINEFLEVILEED